MNKRKFSAYVYLAILFKFFAVLLVYTYFNPIDREKFILPENFEYIK